MHDQALVWSGGFGWADVERREPATADTLYRIGSITKLFTATALLILRDAGKLHLDDPLVTHLPWFQMKAAAAEAGTITIRHLLTHTSGLPREGAFPYFTDSRFPSVDDIRARLPMQERPFPAETRWKYSNLGATLAGEVVTALAGEPYVDFVRRRILEPLGMTATLVASPDPALPRLATGYARRLLGSTPAPFNDLRGHRRGQYDHERGRPRAVRDAPAPRRGGRRRPDPRDVQIIVRGGELTVIGPDGPDPLLAPATLRPVAEHTFRVETPDGYGIPGELVVFETDPAGRVRRARFGENYTERIETWEDR